MFDVFTMLKMFKVNHRNIGNSTIVVTNVDGKPNILLTGLLRDVISSINIFTNIGEVATVQDLIDDFSEHTPLPEDVLSEYDKILKQTITSINFATRKGQIELVF